jgi:hypothetical protein
MRLDRLRSGELLAGTGGALLVVALFLPWFGDADAWQAFDVLDLVLLLAGLTGVAVAVIAAANAKSDAPIASAALIVPVGLLATLLVLYRVLDPVGDSSRRIGLYLGLAGGAAIAYGCWRSIRDERADSAPR